MQISQANLFGQIRGIAQRKLPVAMLFVAMMFMGMMMFMGISSAHAAWTFTDHTAASGLDSVHGPAGSDGIGGPQTFAGGVAVGDYNADGWHDVYLVGGPEGGNGLFRNRGDGTFENVTAAARLDREEGRFTGPLFADINGDGWLDLVVHKIVEDPDESAIILYENLANGRFANATLRSGIVLDIDTTFSPAFADVDQDGDLDLFVSHWGSFGLQPPGRMMWRNEGDFRFTDISREAGFDYRDHPEVVGMDWSLTPTFADFNDDGYPDLLLTGEFGTVRIFLNQGDGTFVLQTTDFPAPISATGSAVGDYDNDGQFDIFAAGVFDPDGVSGGDPALLTGNRLYRNEGGGLFTDTSVTAGVRDSGWAWSAEFGDLNLDGYLDIYVVNGAGTLADGESWRRFVEDPARLFVADGAGGFAEQAELLGVADIGIGRGTVQFDFDRDGDLDILNQNSGAAAIVYRNDLETDKHFLVLKLIGHAGNWEAVGARVSVTTGAVTQIREIRNGSSLTSAAAAEAHFGLGTAGVVDELRVAWPDGAVSVFTDVTADRHLVLRHPGPCFETCTAPGGSNLCSLGGKTRSPMECLMELRISPTPPNDKRGGPGYRIDCQAGDPACDADPDDTTSCSVDVALCLSNDDPRNFVCGPSQINRLRVRTPRLGSQREQDQLTRAFGLRLIGDGGAAMEVVDGSPFEQLQPGLCSGEERLTVPLRERTPGVLRKSSTRLKIQAFSTDGRRDLDQLLIRCSPAD